MRQSVQSPGDARSLPEHQECLRPRQRMLDRCFEGQTDGVIDLDEFEKGPKYALHAKQQLHPGLGASISQRVQERVHPRGQSVTSLRGRARGALGHLSSRLCGLRECIRPVVILIRDAKLASERFDGELCRFLLFGQLAESPLERCNPGSDAFETLTMAAQQHLGSLDEIASRCCALGYVTRGRGLSGFAGRCLTGDKLALTLRELASRRSHPLLFDAEERNVRDRSLQGLPQRGQPRRVIERAQQSRLGPRPLLH